MKVQIITIALILCSCSSSLDGLWIENNENALLYFSGDSVITNSLQLSWFRDTLIYRSTKDSIYCTGLNPILNEGRTKHSFKYVLVGDSLTIWDESRSSWHIYKKTQSKSYLDYFTTKNGLKIKLPQSDNSRLVQRRFELLNISIGYEGKAIKIFVANDEVDKLHLETSLSKFRSNTNNEIVCQIFMDDSVQVDYLFWLFGHLRSQGISTVCLITQNKDYDPYTSDFLGLLISVPTVKLNLVEEKNER